MPETQLIIVTGAGRSGTSAVAQVLHQSGCSMGRDLHAPTEFNPTGYYEDRRVCALNDAILAGCGLDRFFGDATRAQVLAAATPHAPEMARLAAQAGGGWKDPRFSWTLEAWLPALAAPPRLVVCLRSPQAVADSTMRRYGQTSVRARRHVTQQWSRQYQRLLEVIAGYTLDAITIEYEDLIAAPERTVERLAAFAGRPLAAASVDRALRHEDRAVAPRQARLYRQVRALSSP